MLVVIPLLLTISFVFYMLGRLDAHMFGAPDDELDLIINSKMKNIIKSIDYDSDKIYSDKFEKIAFGMKMVPSMDNHHELMQKMYLVGGKESQYTGIVEGITYDENSIGET